MAVDVLPIRARESVLADCTLMHDGVMGEGWERVGDGDGWERGDKCRDSRVSAGGGGGQ